MEKTKPIRVLIVDDSAISRAVLSRGLARDPGIAVVARAADPFEAMDQLRIFRPDVITCDIQMPKMDGIEFIRRLLPRHPIPVVVVSGISEAVFDALNAGAVDFIEKPLAGAPGGVETFIDGLIQKIKAAAGAKIKKAGAKAESMPALAPGSGPNDKKIVAIGASTGGTEAIFSILRELPPAVPGIVIVQHMPPVFSALFAERLNRQTALEVREARDGDYVAQGRVLLAPGGFQMTVKRAGGKYRVSCFEGEKRSGHCPSADVLFSSVARAAGGNAVGVILTGMGGDGAEGLRDMRSAGARTIGQNERSSVVYGMPRMALLAGAVERELDLSAIAGGILEALSEKSG